MTLKTIDNLLKQAARLTPAERLLVACRLLEGVQNELTAKPSKALQWRDLSGMLPYPAYGEDAQAYITRTRRADTENRESKLKRKL
jgi:hypothetical protein